MAKLVQREAESGYPREVIDPVTGEIGLDMGPPAVGGQAAIDGGMDLSAWTVVTGATYYDITVNPQRAFFNISVGTDAANTKLYFGRTSDNALIAIANFSAPFSWTGRVNGANKIRIAGLTTGNSVSYSIIIQSRDTGEQVDYTPIQTPDPELAPVGLEERVRLELARRMAVMGFSADDQAAVLDDAEWAKDSMAAQSDLDEEFGLSPYEEDEQGFVRSEREAAVEAAERAKEEEKRLEALIAARAERRRQEARQLDLEEDYLTSNSQKAIAARAGEEPPSRAASDDDASSGSEKRSGSGKSKL